ncbi:MAG: gliding motility-associated C-terminal domain-containing protein, partial [Saprospiraceae bacterium]|nr:gliding motility-associated C-terminal domain-containing protein [Saprospiraceae bacterium]
TYTGTYQATATVLICGQGVDYLDTLVVTSGPCDSLFITQYQYIPLDTTWLTGSTCQVSQAGTFVLVLPDQFGCDSTIITVVALQPSDTTLVEGVTCNKADEFYDAQTLTNQWGCDSVVWTAIIYIGVDTQYLQQTTCDPALAGIQTVVIPGPFCDTVRVIETTLVQEVVTTLVNVVCGPPGLPADTLYFSGTNGCDSLVIIQYDYQEVDAEAEVQDETCQGWQDGQISVSGITGGLPPYTFQLNSGAWQNTTLFSGLSPGAYQVIVADQQGCRDTLAGLSIGTGPTLVMDAGADLLVDIGALVDLSVQVSDPLAQVTWTAIDPIDCPSCVQTVIGPITSDQTVVVSGISQEGCPGSDQILLQTRVRNRVYVPNSFSPNVDGINDLFSVYALDDQLVVRNLSIFDRWGNALYQGVDLKVNDPAQGWDGTSRGKPLDPGVYVYVIELEDASGQRLILKGEVHLLR